MKTGIRSGANSSGRVGWSHASACRTPRTDPAGRRATSCDHAPAVRTSRSASTTRAIGAHANAAPGLLPLEHTLARAELGAAAQRACDVRDDAALGDDEAPVGLVDDLELGREPVRGKAPSDLGADEHLVLEVVVGAGPQDALRDLLAPLDDPGDREQPLARFLLELVPELVGAADERHVVGVLEVGEPDDARVPVRGPVLVEHVEALDAQDALPAAREVVERRASHPADSDDDGVVALCATAFRPLFRAYSARHCTDGFAARLAARPS